MHTGLTISALLRRNRFRLGHEDLLQQDVEALFRREGVPYQREFILGPADRVDFLVDGRIAVELKIRARKRVIYGQLVRYAAHDIVESLVLASVTPMGIPPMANGKVVHVVPLGLSGL